MKFLNVTEGGKPGAAFYEKKVWKKSNAWEREKERERKRGASDQQNFVRKTLIYFIFFSQSFKRLVQSLMLFCRSEKAF